MSRYVELEPERMEFFLKTANGNSVDCQFANPQDQRS